MNKKSSINRGAGCKGNVYPALSSTSKRRLPSLDVLRAVAALAVFILHSAMAVGFDKFSLRFPNPIGVGAIEIPNFMSLGAMGVSLFFVLSGYCITRSWYLTGSAPNWTSYYRHRFLRIYPAYLFAVLMSACAVLVIHGFRALEASYQVGAYPIFVDSAIHALFLQGFDSHSFLSMNGALWSMSTEVQFYIALPAIYLLTRHINPVLVALIGLLICITIRWTIDSNPELATPIVGGVSNSVLLNYSFMGRFFEFLLGLTIASLESKGSRILQMPWWVVAAFGLIAVALRWRGPHWLIDPAWGMAFASILVIARRTLDAHAFSETAVVRIAQKAGMRSYSFFLIHFPILALVSYSLDVDASWSRFFMVGGLAFILSAVAAIFMYRFIENIDWQIVVTRLFKLKHVKQGGT